MPHSLVLSFKIVLIGDTGVGKSSILVRHKNHTFSHINPTIGCSFTKSDLYVKGRNVQLQIWDTAGQERFRAMAPMYYRNSEGAIAVYDTTSEDSFNIVKSWIEELKAKDDKLAALCILGNKCDLVDKRRVPFETGKLYADSLGALFYETSALSNRGIDDAFFGLAQILTQKLCPEAMRLDADSVNFTSRRSRRSCCL